MSTLIDHPVALASMRVEALRLRRSGLLIALFATFGFFGLSGPVLALYLPQILGAASGSDQLTIEATAASAESGLMLFNQSAMQLGLIFAVAVAVTSLHWDARPGSSIFYRTRNAKLSHILLPRFALDCVAVIAAYTVGALCAAVLSALTIGGLDASQLPAMLVGAAIYLSMCMSIGLLVMSATRRTASAIALATVLVLILPLAGYLPGAAGVAPSALLNAGTLGWSALGVPAGVALGATALCLVGAVRTTKTRSLRRDA